MSLRLDALTLAALDPARVGRFWSGLLGWELVDLGTDGAEVVPLDRTGWRLALRPTTRPKEGPNPVHLDVTSGSADEQRRMVERARALGGRLVDVGQSGDEGHEVLGDPEGNELCVIEPGNGFLAGCGVVGAVNCDGSQAVGYFWSRALGWPLVWDQDQETAIQSPAGGSKVTWSGPPLMERHGPDRFRFDLATAPEDDLDVEVARLVGLGATVAHGSAGAPTDGVRRLADPDGVGFTVGRTPARRTSGRRP